MKRILPLSLLFLGMMGGAKAQTCGTTISSFPYVEFFDGASAPGWTAGGTNSSWALGTPSKTIINSAASGTKAWVTSLNGNYNLSENSYVESPCFNMTNLTSPVVAMKIWWNSEFSYDGAVLQSSIDGGATWQNVGIKGDPNNWYNDNTINGAPGGQPAASAQGWTGRVFSSNGSNGWVLSKHDLTGLAGKPNVKLRFAFGSDNFSVDEGFAFDSFTIYDTPANDASVTSITAPVSPVTPGTAQPVSVIIRNFGTTALSSATLGFSVNGVAQPTFAWTGGLAPNALSSPIQIGTYTFGAGLPKIKAWSKLPNALADGNPSNDTTEITINSCYPVSGNITINKGAAASATNYTSIAAAMQQLGSCGVSGPITITVVPNSGPYNEQVIIPVIPGTSATNTVTLEGNGNTISAVTGSTFLGVITVNGADYLRLNNFKIEVDAAASSGWGIQLLNASDNDIVSNCTINLPIGSTSTLLNGIVSGSSSVTAAGNFANNLLIQNNIVNGGNYGILLNGVISGTPTSGNRILNNQVKDANAISIYLNNGGTGTIIEGNDISRANRLSSPTFYGIYLAGNNINTTISKNRIHNTNDATLTSSNTVYGVYSTSPATAGNENIIKNNVFYNINNNGGAFYAFYNGGAHYTSYYYNTIAADNPAITYAALRGLYAISGANNLKFNNNILSLSSPATSKHAMYLIATSIGLASNYNDIYIGSSGNIGYIAADIPTFAAWQAANTNAYDQNSVSTDPQFVSTSYLQPLAAALDNIGTPISGITDAINGAIRSTTTPDPGAYEFTPATTDAGIIAINSPTTPVTPGNQPVNVTLKNFGSANLTTATISWSVNGVAQPNFAWTGNLATLQTSATPVTIGNYNFVGGNYTIKVWSKSPNGATDGLAVNDTTILNAYSCAPLAGNYTVNKNNPTAGTNFHSLSEIAQRLTTCGVSGAVTVTVTAGTGPYNEQVEIGNIPYTSATNTVTFEGSGNTVSATPGLRPGVFVLNGTKYTKLNNFVITMPGTITSAYGVQLTNFSDFNTISNNTINIPLTLSATEVAGIVAGTASQVSGNNASNTKIINNIINGGNSGIQINGNTNGINAVNNQITGNVLKDQFNLGIFVNNASGTLVENNDISRPARTAVSTIYGISLTGNSINTVISKNRVHNTHDAATALNNSVYGIYITGPATVGNENIIKNNLIYNINNNGGSLYGIQVTNGNGSYIYHNTIATDPATSYVTLRGVYISNAVSNIKLINNIVSLPSSGTTKHAIYIGNATAAVTSNNNDLYVGSTTGAVGYFGGDFSTLANWKAANSNAYDQNSVSADPVFAGLASGNLTPTSVSLDNVGMPVAAVTEDYAGATRNSSTPDIGAYEFGVPANDVGVIAVSGPAGTGCGLSASETITVTLKNFGAAAQTTIPVSYAVNGTPIPLTETFSGSLAPGATANYSFTAKANLAVAGTYRIIAKTLLAGDITTSNDPDTLDVTNTLISGTPAPFDFETVATGISKFRKVIKSHSNIMEGAGASTGLSSTKGMIMEGATNTNWVTPVGVTDPWTNNPDNFAGAYMCIIPSNFTYPDSLWLTMDLKQTFKTANANTNFRITVNGNPVSPTFRPPFTGTPISWQKVKVDLTAFKNQPILTIGLESSASEAYANGAGTANLIDNIQFRQHVTLAISGNKKDMLANQIHVFPNPSNGRFLIDLPAGKAYQFQIIDLTGKVILQKTANGNTQLNLENAAKGIYILKVSGENGTATRKLIIE